MRPVDPDEPEGAQVEIDDIVVVRPGERIPVEKAPGSTVTGATINKHGSFKFRATRVGRDTALQQIIKMVERAQGVKAPIQRMAGWPWRPAFFYNVLGIPVAAFGLLNPMIAGAAMARKQGSKQGKRGGLMPPSLVFDAR